MVTPAEAKMNRLARRQRRREKKHRQTPFATHYVARQTKAKRQRRVGGRFAGGYCEDEEVDVVTCADVVVPCHPVILHPTTVRPTVPSPRACGLCAPDAVR